MSLVEQTRRALSAGGPIARVLPGFHERQAQIALGMTIADALEEGSHVSGEAGTGLGKSLSYLVPAVRSGKRVLVSTATKALQDQLAAVDLPTVARALGPFPWVILKGAGNYACLRDYRRAHEAIERQEPDALTFEHMAPLDKALADTDWNGDLDHVVGLSPRARSAVKADPDTCTGATCPFADRCYWREAKSRAEVAQVIVTNHALLAVAIARNRRALPDFEIAFVDEAHDLVNKMRDAFSSEFKQGRVGRLLRDLHKRLAASSGWLVDEGRAVALETLAADVEELDRALWQEAESAVTDARVQKSRGSGTLSILLPDPLLPRGTALLEAVGALSEMLPTFGDADGNQDGDDEGGGDDEGSGDSDQSEDRMRAELVAGWQTIVRRADNLTSDLRRLFSSEDPNLVRSLSADAGSSGHEMLSLLAQPIDIAPQLKARLFDRTPVITLSATLANAPDDFSYFREQSGMPAPPASRMFYMPYCFDFQRQALIYIPGDVRPPDYTGDRDFDRRQRERWIDALAGRMLDLVRLSSGRAFLLFSAHDTLRQVSRLIEGILAAEGCSVLIQGEESSDELLRRFRNLPRPVLFGTRTFMQGVDIVGEQLSLVTIDKMPFPAVDSPLEEAIRQRLDPGRGVAFYERQLPEALLLVKQASGRLIRSEQDTGVIAILDGRVHIKNYGVRVRDALPPAPITTRLLDVADFFTRLKDMEAAHDRPA